MPDRLGGIVGHIKLLCDHIERVQSRIAADDAQVANLQAKIKRVNAQRARHDARLNDLKKQLQTAGTLLATPDDIASQTLLDQPLGTISDLSEDNDDDGPDEIPATRAAPVAKMRAATTSPATAGPVPAARAVSLATAAPRADSTTASPNPPQPPLKPFIRDSPDLRASTTPYPKKPASPPTKLIQPRQIHPNFPTVVHFNNTWVELTCFWCGANSKGKGKGTAPTFFNGARGLKRHCGAHTEGLGQCEVTEFCSMRVVSQRDVSLLERGRQAEEVEVVHVLGGGVGAVRVGRKRVSDPRIPALGSGRDSSALLVTPRTAKSLRDYGFERPTDISDNASHAARPTTAPTNGSSLKRKRTTNEYIPPPTQSQEDVDLAMRPPPVIDDPMDGSWQPPPVPDDPMDGSWRPERSTAEIKYEELEGEGSSGDDEYEN